MTEKEILTEIAILDRVMSADFAAIYANQRIIDLRRELGDIEEGDEDRAMKWVYAAASSKTYETLCRMRDRNLK